MKHDNILLYRNLIWRRGRRIFIFALEYFESGNNAQLKTEQESIQYYGATCQSVLMMLVNIPRRAQKDSTRPALDKKLAHDLNRRAKTSTTTSATFMEYEKELSSQLRCNFNDRKNAVFTEQKAE